MHRRQGIISQVCLFSIGMQVWDGMWVRWHVYECRDDGRWEKKMLNLMSIPFTCNTSVMWLLFLGELSLLREGKSIRWSLCSGQASCTPIRFKKFPVISAGGNDHLWHPDLGSLCSRRNMKEDGNIFERMKVSKTDAYPPTSKRCIGFTDSKFISREYQSRSLRIHHSFIRLGACRRGLLAKFSLQMEGRV